MASEPPGLEDHFAVLNRIRRAQTAEEIPVAELREILEAAFLGFFHGPTGAPIALCTSSEEESLQRYQPSPLVWSTLEGHPPERSVTAWIDAPESLQVLGFSRLCVHRNPASSSPTIGALAIFRHEVACEDVVHDLLDVTTALVPQTVRHDALDPEGYRELERRAVGERTTESVFIHETPTEILYVNDNACTDLGYSREELIGRSIEDFAIRYPRAVLEDMVKVLRPGQPLILESEHKRKDGTTFPTEVTVQQFEHRGRQLNVASVRNISHRKYVEQKLRDHRNVWRQLNRIEKVVSWGYDLETECFTHVAGGHRELLGYESEEWTQPGFWSEHIHPEDREWVTTGCATATERLQDHRFQYRMTHRDGSTVWVDDIVEVEHRDGGVLGLTGLFLDITDQRVADLRARNRARSESSGRLAGGVAHEINNAMTVVQAYTELIDAEHGANDDSLHECLSEIREASQRVSGLTSNLLLMSRHLTSNPEPLDIHERLGLLENEFRSSLPETVALKVQLGAEFAECRIVEEHFDHVIRQLVEHACTAVQDVGTIEIRTKVASCADDRLRENGLPREYLQIAIHDDGPGIDAPARESLFEPFASIHRRTPNSGLGLAVSRGIAHRHGGDLVIHDDSRGGTSFVFELPLIAAHMIANELSPEQATRRRPVGRRILLVEDDRAIREALTKGLTEDQFEVQSVATGRAAVQIVRDGARPDILVTDVSLSDMDGRRVLHEISSIMPGLCALLMTGYANPEAARTPPHDPVRFLMKPFSVSQLTQAIEELRSSAHNRGPIPVFFTGPSER
ncbi:MAG: PAS domain S-box protein [Planctomycetota bacterium]